MSWWLPLIDTSPLDPSASLIIETGDGSIPLLYGTGMYATWYYRCRPRVNHPLVLTPAVLHLALWRQFIAFGTVSAFRRRYKCILSLNISRVSVCLWRKCLPSCRGKARNCLALSTEEVEYSWNNISSAPHLQKFLWVQVTIHRRLTSNLRR